ncbi:alpha/beta hydrolase [uncultured Roseobacter sp.]|uniref:alpha/beta hydrolase n=1 Tax=uncultured Roseobacter sp. TaxID=114847 RepID=UPI00261A179F|nr:alpha/beta hydrolase [uncultured Roseobacter sp.]
MTDWATASPGALRRAHRIEGRGRGALPDDVQVQRIKGALTVHPSRQHTAAGTLLWWHGGGFVAGHPLRALAPAAWIASTAGMACVLPLWPLTPEAKWPVQAEHARAWCDRMESPVYVGGDSAGGAVALACADLAEALVLAYPALGGSPGQSVAAWGTRENGLDAAAVRAMYDRLGAPSLSEIWKAGLPPCLLLTGDREALADDAAVLARLGDFDKHVTPGAGHGFLRDAGRIDTATKAAFAAGQWLKSLRDR